MAGNASRAAWKDALDIISGRARPAQITPYLALLTDASTPASNSLGTEYAATGYARQAVTWTAPTDADPTVLATSGDITFGPFTGTVPSSGSGVIKYGAVMDASSGGTAANQRGWTQWTATKTPAANDSVVVRSAQFTITGGN